MQLRQGYIKDGIGYIPLTQDKWALVDAHNFHWLSQFNWCAKRDPKNGRWYAMRQLPRVNGRQVTQRMHRLIMGATKPTIEVDHRNGDGLLNTEANLRAATHAQNQRNQGPHVTNKTGFKGVSWFQLRGKWRAQIRANGKSLHLGYFDTPIHAAAAYNFAAKRLHKEFAVLNDLSTVTEEQLQSSLPQVSEQEGMAA